MNERQILHHSQSKVVCRNFLGLWLLKHWKIRIAYRQWRSNFPRRGRKPIYEKKNSKLRIQWLWCWHFSRLRTKIDNWKTCYRPISAVYLKYNREFCNLKITPIVVFVVMIQRIFPSWASVLTQRTTFIRRLSIKLFSFINEVSFSSQLSAIVFVW